MTVINEQLLRQRQLLLLVLLGVFVISVVCVSIAIVVIHSPFQDEFTGMQNVLFIVVDDLRPALGCYGDERAITPNIDQLASRSVIFKNAYAQQALCAPSRTSFLTSRRPDSLHLYDTGSYWRDSVGNFTTIPQHFKFHDYETISIGKVFHHGIVSNMTDDYPYSWTEYPYRPPTQKFKMRPVCPSSDGKNHMNLICPVDVAKQPGGSLPDIESTQYAINYLKSKRKGLNKDKPFFMGIGYYKPHIPFKFPREYLDLYPIDSMDLAPNNTLPPKLPEIAWNPWTDIRLREDVEKLNVSFPYGSLPEDFQKLARQGYYASLSYMDDQLGKLLKALEDTGYAEHTVIILIGDHGWSLGEHQEWSKYSNFEVSVKVPLVLHIPGITDSKERKAFKHISVLDYVSNENKTMSVSNMNISASTYVPKYVTNELVELVDLFPTLADIVNIPIPPLCRFYKTVLCSEGLTFYPLIKHIVKGSASEEFPWKTAAFSQYPRPSISPRNDSDQPDLEDIKYMGYSIRTARFRYTEWVSFDSKRLKPNRTQVVARELYDHKEDPFEANNVSDKPMYENIKKELSRKIKKGWRHAMPPGLFDSPFKKKEYLS